MSDTYGESNLDLDKRLPACPNCGAALKSHYIGNMYGNKRKIKVKCTNKMCRIERTDAALTNDFVWLENCQLEHWKHD